MSSLPHSTRDRIGRGLLVLQSVASVGAFVQGVTAMIAAEPDRFFVETWRTFAFLVFAGLFAILAVRPRTSPGAWELVLLHKIAVTVIGFAAFGVFETQSAVPVDLALVIATALSWVLCHGWLSWRRDTAPADPLAVPAGV